MKNDLEEIESTCMKFRSKARKVAADLEEVSSRCEHYEQSLDSIWGVQKKPAQGEA